MKYYEAMGLRVNQLCKEKNIKKKELAKEVGVSYSTIIRITQGKGSNILYNKLLNFCWALGVSANSFFNSPLFAKENINKIEKKKKR